jgi:hypothetical protein
MRPARDLIKKIYLWAIYNDKESRELRTILTKFLEMIACTIQWKNKPIDIECAGLSAPRLRSWLGFLPAPDGLDLLHDLFAGHDTVKNQRRVGGLKDCAAATTPVGQVRFLGMFAVLTLLHGLSSRPQIKIGCFSQHRQLGLNVLSQHTTRPVAEHPQTPSCHEQHPCCMAALHGA